MAEFVGGATWGTATVGACFGSEMLTDLTLFTLTFFEDDFATPADLLGCLEAARSCRVDCGSGTGFTFTVFGFGFTLVTTYEFFQFQCRQRLTRGEHEGRLVHMVHRRVTQAK